MTGPQGLVPTRRSVLTGALGVGAIGGTMAASTSPAAAQAASPAAFGGPSSYYLRYKTVDGDVTAAGFEKSIEVRSWAWGSDDPTVDDSFPVARGNPVSRIVEMAAPSGIHSRGMLMAMNSRATASAPTILSCVRPEPDRLFTYMSFAFNNVVLFSYAFAVEQETGQVMDTFTFRFDKVTQTVQVLKTDGSTTKTTYTYDYGTPPHA